MKKKKLILLIRKHLQKNGAFGIGELEEPKSIYVGELGDIVALAEYFTMQDVEVFVYHTGSSNSDCIHQYKMDYDKLSVQQLTDILASCVQYELQMN